MIHCTKEHWKREYVDIIMSDRKSKEMSKSTPRVYGGVTVMYKTKSIGKVQ